MNDAMQTAKSAPYNATAILLAAERYAGQGFSVIPVPYRSKNPGIQGWEKLRLKINDLERYFNGHAQNIGLLLGEPSGWLIDVDLDHQLAVKLAPEYLPTTPAVFGRAGNPRSHWIYRVTKPVETKKFRSRSAGMLVEVRSTGMQTVFPPSTHESGEPIEWEDDHGEPALVDPTDLMRAATELADAIKKRLGESNTKSLGKPPYVKKSQRLPASAIPADERAERCFEAMVRMRMIDRNDGSLRLYAAACRIVEHDLDDQAGLTVIRQYAREHPFPREWSDAQVLKRVRDAEKACGRGAALELRRDEDGLISLGANDPATGKLVLSPKRTLPTAKAFVRHFHNHPDGRSLHCHAGTLLEWTGSHYAEVEDEAIKKQLQSWLHEALRYTSRRSAGLELVPFESNPTTVRWAQDTIKADVHLSASITPPTWLGPKNDKLPAEEFLPCKTVLLHLPTMKRQPPTPALFVTNALDFDPDPSAPEPKNWFHFLHELFDGDIQSLDLLQHWFGYCLTADTSQQKMLLIVGPRRSGKGTIARVLAQLVGLSNVCGPTTSSLAGNFGLQPLIGKTLAIVSDARFGGNNLSTVVERLLCISGEDSVSIDRKFLPSTTMKLPTRFMFLTNELPRLSDTSGALAGRFMLLRLAESFYGREDTHLTDNLFAELPGILNWAIEGWQRLHERGCFVMPESVADAVQDLEDLSSPVGAFVRDECIVGPGYRVQTDELYKAWTTWCERDGRTIVSTCQSFGRDLAAAVPGIARRRSTGMKGFYDGIGLRAS